MRMRRKIQRGFSLVSAIFLLVVIAALGVFVVTISVTQQQSAALDVLGSRAYQAARAGIEWGVYQLLITPAGIACTAAGTDNAVAMPAASNTLAAFTVTVNCVSYPSVTEASSPITMYQLKSTAKQGTANTADYVERQISATIAH